MIFAATDTQAAGSGTPAPDNYNAYTVDVASGKYNLTLNLGASTLSVDPFQDDLFLGGPATNSDGSWTEHVFPTVKDYTKRVFKYSGHLYNGELKFYDSQSFSAEKQYVAKNSGITPNRGDKYVVLNQDGSHDDKFNMIAGYYNLEIDIEDMVMTVSDKMYLLGTAANGWAWSDAIEMIYDRTSGKYIYSGELNAGEFKFCPWYDDFTTGAIVAGESVVNVASENSYTFSVQDGSKDKNFNITEAGNYTLILDPTSYELTVHSNAITNEYIYMVGSAIGTDGWDNDHATHGKKIYRQPDGSYSFKGYLYSEQFKFTTLENGYGEGDWVALFDGGQTDDTVNKNITVPGTFNVVPWEEHKDRKFWIQNAGYYEMTVNLNTGILNVTKYIGDIFYIYGAPTGSGETVVNDHGTMITETYLVNGEEATRHVWRGHLAPGKLKVAKYSPGATTDYIFFGATKDITEYTIGVPANTTVTSDASPLNTSAAGVTNIVRSYYEMGTFDNADASDRFNFDVKGGYYEIALEQYLDDYIIRFNTVRDVLRMVGEAVGGWDFEKFAIPMQATTEGFVYKAGFTCPDTDAARKSKFEGYQGYLMGLELKFCEQMPTQDDPYGAFYTHAWGPREKDDVPVKDLGTFGMSELTENDMLLDYKFDIYPGDYDILVNLAVGNESMTVRSFVPHQKVVVSGAGMATFMTPYHTADNTTVDGNPGDFMIYKAKKIKKRDGSRPEVVFESETHFEASTPYIIKASPGTYNITPEGGIAGIAMKVNAEQNDQPAKYGYDYEKNFVHEADNLLVGNWHMSVKRENSESEKFYLLQKQSEAMGGLAFYYMEANTPYSLAPYSCYLDITGVEFDTSAPAKVMKMIFINGDYEDINTGIDAVSNEYVVDEIYSVGGVRTDSMQKGINIVRMADGKVRKIMMK